MTRFDWNPALYARFRNVRLQPAADLAARIGALPPGALCDLGCGAGVAGVLLRNRFPGRQLIGVDSSPAMLEKAGATGDFDALVEADAGNWAPAEPLALIYANALLHWLPDHAGLLPRLASHLLPGGVLAVQMPHQNDAPRTGSGTIWRRATSPAGSTPRPRRAFCSRPTISGSCRRWARWRCGRPSISSNSRPSRKATRCGSSPVPPSPARCWKRCSRVRRRSLSAATTPPRGRSIRRWRTDRCFSPFAGCSFCCRLPGRDAAPRPVLCSFGGVDGEIARI